MNAVFMLSVTKGVDEIL